MNNSELIAALSKKGGMSPDEVKNLLEKTVEVMSEELINAKSITIQGFGTFEVKRKEERLTIHPATHERTLIPPKQVVAFKQSPTFKNRLNKQS
jgi:DNA-binding protein HU-beta